MNREEYLQIRNNTGAGIPISVFFEYYNGKNYNPKMEFTLPDFNNAFRAFASQCLNMDGVANRVIQYFDAKFNIYSLIGSDGGVIKYY